MGGSNSEKSFAFPAFNVSRWYSIQTNQTNETDETDQINEINQINQIHEINQTIELFKDVPHSLGQIYIAGEIGLMEKAIVSELVSELKHISATLQSIANTLKKRLTT